MKPKDEFKNRGNTPHGMSDQLNSENGYPSISLEKPVYEALEAKKRNGKIDLYLGGISVVSFSGLNGTEPGEGEAIMLGDIRGSLALNPDLFNGAHSLEKNGTKSDMKNLAKTFFGVNGDNYVALVQYLSPRGESHEHYHTLDETIVQLVGRSYLEFRSVDDDTSVDKIELIPGDIQKIPPNLSHVVKTADKGSITVPIKQTINGKKDHLYALKSEKRMSGEVERLIVVPHYNSGNEMIEALSDYYAELSNPDKKTFEKHVMNRLKQEGNPNIRVVLEEVIGPQL
ncbi:hypothetical protein ACFLZ7_01355 [Nanoarchaeota archaeon]